MPLIPLGTHALRGIASPCAVFTVPRIEPAVVKPWSCSLACRRRTHQRADLRASAGVAGL